MTYRAQIPYGAYWSTPFARWQGSFANLNSVEMAAHVARRELDKRAIAGARFDYGVLGMTVPQHHSFYGLPWLMGLIGAPEVGGPTINQACATGTRALLAAAQAGLPVRQYAPTEIKLAVTGYGRSGKAQVQELVRVQLGLSLAPEPWDAADALAVALCHHLRSRAEARLEAAR